MVASGLGVSVLPSSALVPRYASKVLRVVPFSTPVPSRKVALAWRTSFDRPMAVDVLADAIQAIKMPCLKMAEKAA
jgi:LysR family hydrogen peroxide-inducible transcriptional activator